MQVFDRLAKGERGNINMVEVKKLAGNNYDKLPEIRRLKEQENRKD